MEFTVENVRKYVPKTVKNTVTEDFINKINRSLEDSEIAEQIKENIFSYSKVLFDGRYKLSAYISAVKFVSYRMLEFSIIKAYELTFPERYARLSSEGSEHIAAYASMYAKGKLVAAIMEQTLIPSYVLNQHMYQDALNVSYQVMIDPSQRGMVRMKAAEIILQHTKQPEKTLISVDVNTGSSIEEMRSALAEMATTQRAMLENNRGSLRDIIEVPVIVDVATNEEVSNE